MGDGSSFDDAPRHSDFGVGQDGSMCNDFSDSAAKASENIAGYKQLLAVKEYREKTMPLIGELFAGEASFDEVFTVIDSSLTLAVNAIEGVELLMAVEGAMTGDPVAMIAAAAETWVSVGMTFILEYFQPVQDLFGMLTGNPGRIRTSKEMWLALAEGLSPIGEAMVGHASRLRDVWRDSGSDAAQLRLLEGNDVIQVAAVLSLGVAEAMEFCATTFEKIQGFIMNRTADLVGFLIEFIPEIVQGPPRWALVLLDLIPMLARITLELVQIGLHVARALGAILALVDGAVKATEDMGPYIDRMGETA